MGGECVKKSICRLLPVLICIFFLLCLPGCGKQTEPVIVTIWHVYGGEVDSPLNLLIEEFNNTVGKEQNIRVKVGNVSNTNTIHEIVLASAYDDPGALSLPDMFISYPKTVLALPDENILVDYRDYFTEEELDGFIPEFVEEGIIHDRLAILPLAKSTEILFVNKTAFDRFSADTGASYEELSTWESLYALAEKYREWSGGKSFFVHDYHFNYFQVGVESLGESFFSEDGVAFGPAFEQVWEPYAKAGLQGGLWLGSGYATEPLRTGDAIVSVASSASVLYYSDIVTYSDNTNEQVEIISLPCPTFQNGEKMVMQRGAGICTVKSDPEREKACMTFLKWLTEPEQNVKFVTSLGYMPVTREGFDQYLPGAVESLEDPMYISLYDAFLQTRKEYAFYTPPQRDDYLDLETRFENLVRLKLTAGQAQYMEEHQDNPDVFAKKVLKIFREDYEK